MTAAAYFIWPPICIMTNITGNDRLRENNSKGGNDLDVYIQIVDVLNRPRHNEGGRLRLSI
jgi:hypothetical protein